MRVSTVTTAATALISSWPLAPLYHRAESTIFSVSANSIPVGVVNNANNYHHTQFNMGFGQAFIEVEILPPALPIPEDITIRISPEKLNIKPTVNRTSNIISFTIPQDAYYIVKLGTLPELVIIADPLQNAPTGNYLDVLDFGANPNTTDATGTTNAFQTALNLSGQTGRVVVAPPGVYLVKNLLLPSNSKLYLAPGSVLRFTGKHEDYKIHWFKTSQNRDLTWWISTAFDSENISIWGRGIIDGNGYESFNNGKIGNNLLVPISTKNFYLEGITFRNSAAWCVTAIATENLLFKNVKVLNRLDMGENDGYDIMHSTNATILHSLAISLDDPYSTKTWRMGTNIAVSWPPDAAREQHHVLIQDAMSWTRCFGLKVGQGVNNIQNDIVFRDATVYSASIGIGINHRWGTSNATNIRFENIQIEATPLMLENRSSWEALFTEGADDLGAGTVDGVVIKDITVRRPGRTVGQLSGLNKDRLIKNVLFQNVRMPGSLRGGRTLRELNVTDVRFATGVEVRER